MAEKMCIRDRGHLLTRSAVFVKMLSYFWVRHCGRPECRRKGKKNKSK